MAGELVGESVVVSDMAEGSQVYNKGYYGYPRPGGGLDLDLLEALFLVECDKLQVFQNGKQMDHASLYRRVARSAEDLQSATSSIATSVSAATSSSWTRGTSISVFTREARPPHTHGQELGAGDIGKGRLQHRRPPGESETSQRTRKDLLLGVVDEEGDITYYTVEGAEPHGMTEESPTTAGGLAAGRFGDRPGRGR